MAATTVASPPSLQLAATFLFPGSATFLSYFGGRLLKHTDRAAGGSAGARRTKVRPAELIVPAEMVVGSSDAMQGILRHIRATIQSDLPVLLLGETGTGKELFARMIHDSSAYAGGRFVAINCAAIPADLLEAELFGVVARAATGVDPRPGLFIQANHGSLFLDEIGDMPARLQAKLLRALQEREVLPVGASAARKFDVRVISASNQRVGELVQSGAFRADLYYRLRGLQFHVPPLRDRQEDIPSLVVSFATKAAKKYHKRIRGTSQAALDLLLHHPWPGNVRELESEVERAVLLCSEGETLEARHFGPVAWVREHGTLTQARAGVSAASPGERSVAPSPAPPTNTGLAAPLQPQIDELERRAILAALGKTGGNKAAAARILAVTRNGLALKIKRLGLC